MSGYKDFTAGAILAAADLENYCQNQAVMRFATAAAHDSALTTVKTKGMHAFIIDVDEETVYNGAAWVAVADLGTAPTWTPTIKQNNVALTMGTTVTSVSRVGKLAVVYAYIPILSAGTAATAIKVTNTAGLNAPIANGALCCGFFRYFDSGTANYHGTVAFDGTDFTFNGNGQSGEFAINPSITAASGDYMTFTATYREA